MLSDHAAFSRKLDKRNGLASLDNQDDFIMTFSQKLMLEFMYDQFQDAELNAVINGLLLYEQNNALLQQMSKFPNLNFDQLPAAILRDNNFNAAAVLADKRYDFVSSHLMLDWLDAGQFIRLMQTILSPDGTFWLSSLGPTTLAKTRSILAEMDTFAHFNDFYDLQDIGDALSGAGFKEVVVESSVLQLVYSSCDILIKDAGRVFACNTHNNRRRTITPKGVLKRFVGKIAAQIMQETHYCDEVEIIVATGRMPTKPNIIIPVNQNRL